MIDLTNNNSQLNADLKAAALRAVLFFDLFDYPLTAYEIWRYLDRPASLRAVMEILDQGITGISGGGGVYFRVGRDKLILERIRRYNVSREKLRLAKRSIALLKILPGIKFIGIANLIGAHNWRPNSDIDLLVISSPGRVWTSRFFAAGLMKLLRRRPQGVNKADKICLSFYVDTTALDFTRLRLNPYDPYFTYWLADLLPVYGEFLYPRLIRENKWLRYALPNWQPNVRRVPEKRLSQPNSFSLALERLLRRWQLKIMPLALSRPGNNSGVVINNHMLKLYVADKRAEIAFKFKQSYENLRSAH
ncbi:MAG TPA: hypothetical protein PKI61_00885 [bacterium]|nr:hypothetical protein [bacterium]HPT29362.1 hypothetical protein [bacterium]